MYQRFQQERRHQVSQNNELQLVVEESGLEKNKVQELMKQFGDDFAFARDLVARYKDIKVTSKDQVDEMQKAREARITLKTLRVAVENTRKELKEQSLREGKAIDGAANIIKALIIPVEEHLEKQEKFIEIEEKTREEQKFNRRVSELSQWVPDITVYDLRQMSEETFQELLKNSKKATEDAEIAKKKLEEDRISKEKIEAEARLKLQKEKEEADRLAAEERRKREELEAKIKKEQEERVAKENEESERKMKILRAPDKEKLEALAKTFKSIEMPSVLSPEARRTIDDIKGLQAKLSSFILTRASQL